MTASAEELARLTGLVAGRADVIWSKHPLDPDDPDPDVSAVFTLAALTGARRARLPPGFTAEDVEAAIASFATGE